MLCEDAGQLRNIRNDLVSGPYFVLHGTPVGGEKWMEYLRTGTVEGGMDDEMKTVFAWKRVERQQNAQLDRAIQVLEKFVTEPFPAGANAREENYRRQVMLSAYFRIAVEKGREDDFIRFCGNVLAEPRHGAIYDDCIILGARCHRMRDGHMAEEFRFVEALAARSSAVSSHARQVAQQYLQRLNAVADWPKTHNIGAYRRYLPPKPKKK
jgi:hypothetical protein